MGLLEISSILGLAIIIGLIIVIVVLQREIDKVECECKKNTDLIRKESLKKSKDVIRGQVSQEFIPMFPEFPYNLSDCKFSGAPLDYIVFKGMSDLRDGNGTEIEVIFADVKVNKSQRSKVQNGIKKAIEEGRVKFETWVINEDKKLIIK